METKVIQNLAINCVIFENLLKMFKSELYHELMVITKKSLDNVNDLPSKGRKKQVADLTKLLKEYSKKIKIAEKYNSEISKDFKQIVGGTIFENFSENVSDLYVEFSKILIKISDESVDSELSMYPCILIKTESESDIVINNENYKINL